MSACAHRFRRLSSGSDEVHRVKYQGETLGIIADWYTGSDGNWRQLAARNPNINPLSMQVGQRIVIPGELVRRRSDLPREFVLEHANGRTATRPVRSAAAKTENESAPPDGSVMSGSDPAEEPSPSSVQIENSLESEVLRDKLEEGLLSR
ncbi:MAG: LysM domain-containing protein [Bdellovibrionota bacterium]